MKIYHVVETLVSDTQQIAKYLGTKELAAENPLAEIKESTNYDIYLDYFASEADAQRYIKETNDFV